MIEEQGVIAGNVYDKYGSKNPVARYLLESFTRQVVELAERTGARDIHEVGCGEGHLTAILAGVPGVAVRGCDFSEQIIATARAEHPELSFEVRSIYDLEPGRDGASLMVCCEVLEHLEDPVRALEVLCRVAEGHVILSVPREPLWRAMNMVRGKYLADLGNTPGHLNHWSRHGFLALVSRHLRVLEVRSPVPWTIALCRVR